ncbi:2-thiouracil desulfurase family protein [Desulforhopalus sp. 52FAK]
MSTTQPICLISSCLLGLCTRYDGKIKQYPEALSEPSGTIFIPICPEQLGGLSTPREAAELTGGDGKDVLQGTAQVTTKSGTDVTAQFILGAKQALQIAQLQHIDKAILKSRSPSCGVTGNIGVTAALFKSHGIITIEID